MAGGCFLVLLFLVDVYELSTSRMGFILVIDYARIDDVYGAL